MSDEEFSHTLVALKRELNCYVEMVYKGFETAMYKDELFSKIPDLMDIQVLAKLFNASIFMKIWKDDQDYIFTKDDGITYWSNLCYKEVCNRLNMDSLRKKYSN